MKERASAESRSYVKKAYAWSLPGGLCVLAGERTGHVWIGILMAAPFYFMTLKYWLKFSANHDAQTASEIALEGLVAWGEKFRLLKVKSRSGHLARIALWGLLAILLNISIGNAGLPNSYQAVAFIPFLLAGYHWLCFNSRTGIRDSRDPVKIPILNWVWIESARPREHLKRMPICFILWMVISLGVDSLGYRTLSIILGLPFGALFAFHWWQTINYRCPSCEHRWPFESGSRCPNCGYIPKSRS